MSRATLTALALALPALSACSSHEEGPAYEFPERAPALPTDQREAPQVTPITATRPLVIGAVDDLTIQPLGAHYEESTVTDRVAPDAGVKQTFFYWATVPALRHAVRQGLVAQNVRAFLDDTDAGVATPYGGTTYPRGVLLLRGELRAFTYARHAGEDLVAADVTWRLLDGDSGRQIAQTRHQVAVQVEADARDPDPLHALGERMAQRLLADPVVRTVLSSRRQATDPLEAGSPRQERDR